MPSPLFDLTGKVGVVSGAAQWEERLRRYGADQNTRLVELKAEGADASWLRGPRERMARAGDLLAFVQRLAEARNPDQRPNDWPGLTRWATELL